MAVPTAPYDSSRRSGDITEIPMVAAKVGYAGTLAAVNSSGLALSAAEATAAKVMGRFCETADNSAGAASAINGRVETGVFLFENSSTDPVTQAMVGGPVYVEDGITVCSDDEALYAGTFRGFHSDGRCWVEVRPTDRYTNVEVDAAIAAATA